MSLKDNFNLKGLDATVGFASHVGDPAAYDSTLATMLEQAGAVFYVKTNVPTAMMIAESVNNVFGRTVNPRNRQLTSGGSSGGESALISLRGSCLGIGTDIGGSLRIPAACTGVFTLRPSFGRFPTLRCRSGMGGQEAVQSVNGPLARTVDDVELEARAVVGARPWLHDPRVLPLPWREARLPERLRIAVMWDDGMVAPTPPVARALAATAERLAAAGHEVVGWDPRDQAQGLGLLGRMFVADGALSIKKELERTGEPMRPEMSQYAEATELGTYEMWQIHLERTDFQKRYLDRWNEAGIDAILCPTTPFSSVRNGHFKHGEMCPALFFLLLPPPPPPNPSRRTRPPAPGHRLTASPVTAVGYTGVFNVLDYSCVSFPTGMLADKDVDKPRRDGYKPLSKDCEEIHAECKHQSVLSPTRIAWNGFCGAENDLDDADLVHGMPISLQLVARRLEEEKVLAMTRRVLAVL